MVRQAKANGQATGDRTMGRKTWEERLFNEDYWERYLDMLARNRFNGLVVIFGYENGGYMAPPYPYLFGVDDFPDVRVVGLSDRDQQRHLRALNRLVEQTHARGLRFTAAIWDHIYRGGVQGPNEHAMNPTPGLVWGLTADDLNEYTKAALAKFLQVVPGLDAIQFRMHGESGLARDEMLPFWADVYDIINAIRPGIRFDARAKGFPDELIDLAIAKSINIRICTKYWAEQMGLPFHPTHINRQNQRDRRHGYADLLRRPQRYPIHWRLWNGGTTRILLWGDPEYARRFAESTHLYDGQGFEVNEPLATKMEGQPHDQTPFELLAPESRYCNYEFERYWHFYQVFGRVSYSPDTPPDVWRREFVSRFGIEAGPLLENALHRASWVLPYAQGYCFPYNRFPTTRGWVEKQRREDLPEYAKAEPSDTGQFLSFGEAAQLLVNGGESARVWPQQSSRWFTACSEEILSLVVSAERAVGDHPSREFVSTAADLRILACLARYHSHRALAGLSYALFERADSRAAFDEAIDHEGHAIEAWEALVAAAGDIYADDLMMGSRTAGLCGHWRDELVELRRGFAELRSARARLGLEPGGDARGPTVAALLREQYHPEDHEPPITHHRPLASTPAGEPLTVRARVIDTSGVKWVRLRYRPVTQFEDYRELAMIPTGAADEYAATIPASDVPREWDLMYFVESMDMVGNGCIWPDLAVAAPYVVVKTRKP